MRLKSTATWLDLPGIEACYQPVGAPSAVDALMNVGHTDALGNHRMAGRYTATPGTAPTLDARGWVFNGSTQYLTTGVVPNIPSQSWSMMCRFSDASGSTKNYMLGTTINNGYFSFISRPGATRTYYGNSVVLSSETVARSAGVLAVAGNKYFADGLLIGTLGVAGAATTTDIYIGADHEPSGAGSHFNGKIQAVAICSRTLTPAEVWLASRQMAYCEQNPDWNAWARRRNYYYAPSAASMRWPGVGRGGPVGGSPGIRGTAQ